MVRLVFVQPGHLDRLQLALRGRLGIVLEVVQFGDPLVQVGVTDVGGVEIGEFLVECFRDVLGVSNAF